MNKIAMIKINMDSYYYAFVRFFAGYYFYAHSKIAART